MAQLPKDYLRQEYLQNLERRADIIEEEIGDTDTPDCIKLLEMIILREYMRNASAGIKHQKWLERYKIRSGPRAPRLAIEQMDREKLFARCVLPKRGLYRERDLRGTEEKSLAEIRAYDLIEKTVSGDWRLEDCEPTVKNMLDANAALGQLFGEQAEAPDTHELRAIKPRIVKRCIRRSGQMDYPDTSDAAVQRGKLLELDGIKKRSRRR